MAAHQAVPSCCVVFLIMVVVGVNLGKASSSAPSVPAIYIFGDSTVDVGTNDYLNSLARADVPYNGIDFPGSKATGRFSNGYNVADQLARHFGFEESPPPYLFLITNMSNFKAEITRGVNFASAGAGLLDETGINYGSVIKVSEQIKQFELVRGNITELKGPKETAEFLSKSLFIFCVGINDIADRFRTNSTISKEQLMAKLQSAYHGHLKNAYELGARRFGIMGIPPFGCCPFPRSLNKSLGGNGGCHREFNYFARDYYVTVDSLLLRMAKELPGMKFSHGNVYKMTQFVFKNYRSFGFTERKTACCGNGNFNAEALCSVKNFFKPNLCQNRSQYLFWDFVHPTQAASQLAADALFSGNTTYTKPINFSQLAVV